MTFGSAWDARLKNWDYDVLILLSNNIRLCRLWYSLHLSFFFLSWKYNKSWTTECGTSASGSDGGTQSQFWRCSILRWCFVEYLPERCLNIKWMSSVLAVSSFMFCDCKLTSPKEGTLRAYAFHLVLCLHHLLIFCVFLPFIMKISWFIIAAFINFCEYLFILVADLFLF